MKKIKTYQDLDTLYEYDIPLIWNDPDPIKDKDYTISYIESLVYLYDEEDTNTSIYIQYNDGGSEAQVFLHEILINI